jgi:hypothetical protein
MGHTNAATSIIATYQRRNERDDSLRINSFSGKRTHGRVNKTRIAARETEENRERKVTEDFMM